MFYSSFAYERNTFYVNAYIYSLIQIINKIKKICIYNVNVSCDYRYVKKKTFNETLQNL